MTPAEAHAAAAAEGLALVRAENVVGFKGVIRNSMSLRNPFQAQLHHGGRTKYLGLFATAEEARRKREREKIDVDALSDLEVKVEAKVKEEPL